MAKRPSKTHKTFKRTYREDYVRKTEIPGIISHLLSSLKIIFKNWKLFLPFILLIIVLNCILVGLMSQETYNQFQDLLNQTEESMATGKVSNSVKAGLLLISTVTTGGLTLHMSDVQSVFSVILFLLIWLVTIFILRQVMAKRKIKLRDALYNSTTPLISTFAVLAVVLIQCIPIFLVVVAYSAAIETNFLSTPFYALVFFIFAALMIILSAYLLSSSLIALVSVTAPGLYPIRALNIASDLMASRRIKFILRLIGFIIAIAIIWVVIMLPLILFDMWMKTFEWAANIPFIPICLLTMTVFTGVYFTSYIYLYYRMLLDYEEK